LGVKILLTSSIGGGGVGISINAIARCRKAFRELKLLWWNSTGTTMRTAIKDFAMKTSCKKGGKENIKQ
jgi:hypothetical protein